MTGADENNGVLLSWAVALANSGVLGELAIETCFHLRSDTIGNCSSVESKYLLHESSPQKFADYVY